MQLASYLSSHGINVASIHGDLNQQQREFFLSSFRKGTLSNNLFNFSSSSCFYFFFPILALLFRVRFNISFKLKSYSTPNCFIHYYTNIMYIITFYKSHMCTHTEPTTNIHKHIRTNKFKQTNKPFMLLTR